MAELNLPNALTRLLIDADLRRAFAHDPSAVAERIAVRRSDRAALMSMKADDLERQAMGLLSKRFHEVSHLLPCTMALLGDDARTLFDAYAAQFWPSGHRRHVIDAVEFCRHLRRADRPLSLGEYQRVRFVARQRRVQLGVVDDLFHRGRPCRGIRIMWRTRSGDVRSWSVWLGL